MFDPNADSIGMVINGDCDCDVSTEIVLIGSSEIEMGGGGAPLIGVGEA